MSSARTRAFLLADCRHSLCCETFPLCRLDTEMVFFLGDSAHLDLCWLLVHFCHKGPWDLWPEGCHAEKNLPVLRRKFISTQLLGVNVIHYKVN